jgi:hypothetical protein
MRPLFHYTCDHGAALIRRNGDRAVPTWQPLLHVHAVWATDMDEPDADALGLTSHTLNCDRTTNRFLVLQPERFVTWRDFLASVRVDPRDLSELTAPPRQPRRWWITADTALVS